jgi:DNA repair exonuclease SbcCD ATPase subunit
VRIITARLQGCRAHTDSTICLDGESVVILGPNGSGKSTVIQAICWALGKAEPRAHDLLLREGTDRLSVTLEIEDHAGFRWLIERAREKATSLSVCEQVGGQWREVAARTIEESQAAIDTLICPLTPDAFRASVYAQQGRIGQLAALTPAARKALFADLLGLDQWERWRDTAAALHRETQAKADTHLAVAEHTIQQYEQITEQINAAGDVDGAAKSARTAVSIAEGRLQSAQKAEQVMAAVRERTALVEQADSLVRAAQAAIGRNQQRQQAQQNLTEAEAACKGLQAADEHLRGLVSQQNAYQARMTHTERARLDAEAAQRDAERLTGEVEQAAQQLAAFDTNPEGGKDCQTCGQLLADPVAHQRAHDALADAYARASERLGASRADAQSAQMYAVECEQAQGQPVDPAQLAAAQAAASALADHRRDAATSRGQLDSLGQPEDVEAMRAQHAQLSARIAQLPATGPDQAPDLGQARRYLAEAQQRLQQAQQAQARVQALRDQHASTLRAEEQARTAAAVAAAEAADAALLVRAFSRNGVPALILDNATAGIEQAANTVLEQIGPGMSISLATQRATKSGTIAEVLDILVSYQGRTLPVEALSGGEQYRVHLALRLGLADATTAATGIDCSLVAIDEPTDLDHAGSLALGDMLRALAEAGRQVLLVTHDDRLSGALPRQLYADRLATPVMA